LQDFFYAAGRVWPVPGRWDIEQSLVGQYPAGDRAGLAIAVCNQFHLFALIVILKIQAGNDSKKSLEFAAENF